MPLIDRDGCVRESPAATSVAAAEASAKAVDHTTTVSLTFDSVMDGKPFSAAAVLRAEGFEGVLVGTGPVGLDRLSQGFRVGFDLLELSATELALLRPCHLAPFPHHYLTAGAAGGVNRATT